MLQEWIKNIVVFTIFFSFILFLVPNEAYKKYIKTAIGFVLIIIVIRPVLQLEGLEDLLDFEYYYQAAGYSISDSDTGYYRDIMESIIEDYILNSYYASSDVNIVFDGNYGIEKMEVYINAANALGDEGSTVYEQELREDLSARYNLEPENIYIYQEG
jgi:stage III sporulation protein AF